MGCDQMELFSESFSSCQCYAVLKTTCRKSIFQKQTKKIMGPVATVWNLRCKTARSTSQKSMHALNGYRNLSSNVKRVDKARTENAWLLGPVSDLYRTTINDVEKIAF